MTGGRKSLFLPRLSKGWANLINLLILNKKIIKRLKMLHDEAKRNGQSQQFGALLKVDAPKHGSAAYQPFTRPGANLSGGCSEVPVGGCAGPSWPPFMLVE
jgi:hypothetical protein